MSNLIVDGFDWMPSGQSSATRDRLWAANEFFQVSGSLTADVTTGRFGFGQAFLFSANVGGNNRGYVVPIGATPSTLFVGGAMFIYPDQENICTAAIGFYDAVNDAAQCFIRFAANGVVKAYKGDNSTLIQTSAANAFQENEWFHFEIKAVIDNTSGSLEVRINTVPVLQITSADTQNTANAYADSICIGYTNSSANNHVHYALDDLFINDTTGTENNDWLGNVRVKTQFMIANGFTNQFTIGGTSPASTHWQSVLNQQLDDTTYEYDSTIGDIDLFTPDPNLNSPLVHSLQVRMGLRQDDATQRMAHAMLRISGTNYEGAVDQFTNQTYTFYKERWQLNPNTGVSFTGADVNALQAGVKVAS